MLESKENTIEVIAIDRQMISPIANYTVTDYTITRDAVSNTASRLVIANPAFKTGDILWVKSLDPYAYVVDNIEGDEITILQIENIFGAEVFVGKYVHSNDANQLVVDTITNAIADGGFLLEQFFLQAGLEATEITLTDTDVRILSVVEYLELIFKHSRCKMKLGGLTRNTDPEAYTNSYNVNLIIDRETESFKIQDNHGMIGNIEVVDDVTDYVNACHVVSEAGAILGRFYMHSNGTVNQTLDTTVRRPLRLKIVVRSADETATNLQLATGTLQKYIDNKEVSFDVQYKISDLYGSLAPFVLGSQCTCYFDKQPALTSIISSITYTPNAISVKLGSVRSELAI